MNQNPDKSYRWDHPLEWLLDNINAHQAEDDLEWVSNVARQLAAVLDGDQIQDLFQAEMDADGYFKPVRKRATK